MNPWTNLPRMVCLASCIALAPGVWAVDAADGMDAAAVADVAAVADGTDVAELADLADLADVAMGDSGWWETAPHEMLADMRGAYDVAPGLRVGFGIDRAVYAHGTLLAHSSGQFGAAPGTPGTPGAPDLPALLLVQQGAGNAVQWSGLAAGGVATLVQNSLNDRQFAVVTTIDATANSMQLLKGVQLDRALQDALTLPLAGHR